MPGIGPPNATARVAAVDSATAFAKRHDMAACLGLTPDLAPLCIIGSGLRPKRVQGLAA
ncbi:MAG: hypothetical protein IH905_11190 [Proteobacteria bacterium]|nr:hypothetical protein [Pseudomonadota bacterium]